MGFFNWLAEPLVDLYHSRPTNHNFDITNVEVIDNGYDIPEYNGSKPPLFRPRCFTDYIGQVKAKNILVSYIEATKERNRTMPHILIYGKAGCGKTTLAKIIANELGVQFAEVITSTLKNPQDLLSKIVDIDGGVLFLDEIHSIERDMAESIYAIMEDFTYNGQAIKPFTLIGATTEYGELLKDRRPFIDRFKVPIELEDYTVEEIAKLIEQYRSAVFPKDLMDKSLFNMLATNARLTPRIAIRLLEATIYLKNNYKQVLSNFSIIKDSYTQKDLKTLKYIAMNDKGVGLQGIASYLGVPMQDYMEEVEPYLLRSHLILRTPRGRKITPEGVLKIKELETL